MPLTTAERDHLITLTNEKRQKRTEISDLVRNKRETRARYANYIGNTNDKNQRARYRSQRDNEINRYDRQIDEKRHIIEDFTNRINIILERGRARGKN